MLAGFSGAHLVWSPFGSLFRAAGATSTTCTGSTRVLLAAHGSDGRRYQLRSSPRATACHLERCQLRHPSRLGIRHPSGLQLSPRHSFVSWRPLGSLDRSRHGGEPTCTARRTGRESPNRTIPAHPAPLPGQGSRLRTAPTASPRRGWPLRLRGGLRSARNRPPVRAHAVEDRGLERLLQRGAGTAPARLRGAGCGQPQNERDRAAQRRPAPLR